MAKKPKIQRMKTASRFFFAAFIGLIVAGVLYIRRYDILTGTELIGLAFVPLAVLFGFTLHTTCKVPTTRRTPCKNDSYGFLFGCTGNGHWLEKFYIRLGFRKNELQQVQHVERRQPDGSQVFAYQPISQAQPLRVTVERSTRDICGFWVGVISMITGIASIIVAIVH